jgi:2-polyprenyl-3-methyl-5-hydroxy-6-metoxy-1,4-benzoquinol methylase
MKLIQTNFEDGYHERLFYREQTNSQRNQARLRLLREYLPAGRLLEIGCGTGGFLSLAEAHFEVEGMDLSRSAIQSIQPHFGSRVRAANIEQAQLPALHYHAVAVFNILEHLQRPEKTVDKIFHALQPNGLLIGSVPFNSHLIGSLITRIGSYVDRTHVSTFPPETWRRIFAYAGFQHVEFFGEVNLGRNRCRYLRGKGWEHLSLNLMFVCQK